MTPDTMLDPDTALDIAGSQLAGVVALLIVNARFMQQLKAKALGGAEPDGLLIHDLAMGVMDVEFDGDQLECLAMVLAYRWGCKVVETKNTVH